MLEISLVAAVLLGAATAGPARSSLAPTPEAVATKLDTEYNPTVWQHIPVVSDFRQRDPKDGAPPSFATDLQVAYFKIARAAIPDDPEQARVHLADVVTSWGLPQPGERREAKERADPQEMAERRAGIYPIRRPRNAISPRPSAL